MRILSFLMMLFLIPSAGQAAEQLLNRPHWSLEVKGGAFYPDIIDWRETYGDRKTDHFAGALAYKIFRPMEVGIDGGIIRATGQAVSPTTGQPAGEATIQIFPLQAFVLFRGIFSEGQWIVPYVGGGWSRLYYRKKIDVQPITRGKADGYHGRAGLQFLLDNLDPSASGKFYLDYGVHHTYFFIEAQSMHATIDTVDAPALPSENIDLGGVSYLAGLLFEF